MVRSRTIIATPPGATIKEQIADRNMSQKELALRMGMSEKHISKLVNGEVYLTQDVALRLEMVLGIPAHFWNNLEAIYREKIAKANAENEMDADMEFAKKLPYNGMSKNGWVPETKKPTERVVNLRKFFEIAALGLLREPVVQGIACRRLIETEKGDYALMAWAQKAKIEARNVETSAINIEKLQGSLQEIRSMTVKNPDVFCPELANLLSSCGIALIYLPHIGGSFLHGASFYDGKKIVIGLTVRGKDADRFWFSLFHELAHVLYGHIGKADITEADEASADAFAREILIPEESYMEFVSGQDFSKSAVIDFAKEMGIDTGIVVGRLQKEGLIPYSWYNDLKTKYVLSA